MIIGLPERLRSLRIKCGLTQYEVCEKLNVCTAVLERFETGRLSPSLEFILAFSRIYNCSTDYLLGKEKSPSN